MRIVKIRQNSKSAHPGFVTYASRRANQRSHRHTSYSMSNLPHAFRCPLWVNMQHPIEGRSLRKSASREELKNHCGLYYKPKEKFTHQSCLELETWIHEPGIEAARIKTHHTPSAKVGRLPSPLSYFAFVYLAS